MKFNVGDQINHYSCGILVSGEIIEVQQDGVLTKHVAVRWGNEIFTETFVPWKLVNKFN